MTTPVEIWSSHIQYLRHAKRKRTNNVIYVTITNIIIIFYSYTKRRFEQVQRIDKCTRNFRSKSVFFEQFSARAFIIFLAKRPFFATILKPFLTKSILNPSEEKQRFPCLTKRFQNV